MRYSNDHNGFINFPKDWEDSGEGGLVVHLFVLDNLTYEDRWEMCIDDNDFMGSLTFSKEMQGWFPERRIKKEDYNRTVLLCMKIASTGKSYYDGDKIFCAKEKDLNEDGIKLFELLRKLYPGRELLLSTTLDT